MILKTKKIEVAHYTWVTSSYYNRQTPPQYSNRTVEEIEVLDENIDDIKNELKKRSKVSELLPNQKVYFDSSAVFPREKFKERFPHNPIKRKMQDADVIVADIEVVLSKFHNQDWNYAFAQDKFYNHQYTRDWQACQGNRFYMNPKEWLLKIFDVENMGDKPIINVADLNKMATKESLVMTVELQSSLERLLNSNLVNDVEMALQMMTDLNLEESKEEIMYLLYSTHYNRLRPKLNVYTKSLIKTIEQTFPRHKYSTADQIGFELGRKYLNTDNSKAQNYFNSIFKKYLKDNEVIEVNIKQK